MIDYKKLTAPYMSLFSGCEDRIAVLDSTLKCVIGSSVIEVGENLLYIVRDPIPNPMHEITRASIARGEHIYGCRIMPVKNSAGESDAYLVETFTLEDLRPLAERADLASAILPMFNAVEYSSTDIWRAAKRLRQRSMKEKDYPLLSEALAIEGAMANISTVCRNTYEYANMLYNEHPAYVTDAADLCRVLGDKCNAALAKCGRHIDVLVELEDLNIRVNSHRAMVALMNALQNELLYSPRDTEPILSVYRRTEHGRAFVEIQVINENIMFTNKDFKDKVDINFSFQRMGFGIPIIKRFVQESGGRFDMRDANGRVILTMSLPGVPESHDDYVQFSEPGMEFYNADTPDLIDIMLMEVVKFFGEKSGADC